MKVYFWAYAIGTVLLAIGLPVFSYLTLIYRELGRMTTGRVHATCLDIFENEIEPKLKINQPQRRPHIPHPRPFLARVSCSGNYARRRLLRSRDMGVVRRVLCLSYA